MFKLYFYKSNGLQGFQGPYAEYFTKLIYGRHGTVLRIMANAGFHQTGQALSKVTKHGNKSGYPET